LESVEACLAAFLYSRRGYNLRCIINRSVSVADEGDNRSWEKEDTARDDEERRSDWQEDADEGEKTIDEEESDDIWAYYNQSPSP